MNQTGRISAMYTLCGFLIVLPLNTEGGYAHCSMENLFEQS